MTSFSDFLDKCGDTVNHSGQTIRDSYNNWNTCIEAFRSNDHNTVSKRVSKPVLEGINLYELSNEEAFFILSYSAHWSSWINNPLRLKSDLTQCQQEYASGLNSVLLKMPKCKIDYLFRMDTPNCNKEDEIKWFEKNIGKIVKVPAFLSVAKSDWDNSPVTWKIRVTMENSIAADLETLRNNSCEDEALYPQGALFIILGIEDKNILLEEIHETTEDIIELSGNYAGCS